MAESEEGKLPTLFQDNHENRIVRAVPLVYSVGTQKYIVGQAILREDGTFTAKIYQIHQMKVKQHLETRHLASMSLSFDPPIPSED